MLKGFSIIELLVAFSLVTVILVLILSNMGESSRFSKHVVTNQERLESIFHTVEMIRSDLTKCGMRLQELKKFNNFPIFENNDSSFKVKYGLENETITHNVNGGENQIQINQNNFFKKGKKIIIYNPGGNIYELNKIKYQKGNQLTLSSRVQHDYPKNSIVVALKEVEYKHDNQQKVLKRKVNKGFFQPVIEGVTDFYIRFFPESHSVLYRIEVNSKEQIRGFIFLTNMVEK